MFISQKLLILFSIVTCIEQCYPSSESPNYCYNQFRLIQLTHKSNNVEFKLDQIDIFCDKNNLSQTHHVDKNNLYQYTFSYCSYDDKKNLFCYTTERGLALSCYYVKTEHLLTEMSCYYEGNDGPAQFFVEDTNTITTTKTTTTTTLSLTQRPTNASSSGIRVLSSVFFMLFCIINIL